MKLTKLIGIAVMITVLLGMGVSAEQASTNVYWGYTGCIISLTVHGGNDIDLGIPTSIGQVLSSTDNGVSVVNSCTGGVEVSVESSAVSDPYNDGTDGDLPDLVGSPHSVFDNFELYAHDATGTFTITGATTFTNFSGLNTSITLGSSINPSTIHLDMDYQYTIDTSDVPGDYSVTLLYTAVAV